MPGQNPETKQGTPKENAAPTPHLPGPPRKMKIPFNKPFIIGNELDYITEAVALGNLAGDGTFTKRCHAWMEQKYSADKVLLTTSCTAALEICAMLCDIRPGDEVIMPSYTFVSTANAFALRGARIRFVDIRKDTLNIDETLIEEAITEKTRAIVPVHYAGVACEMDAIMGIAEKHGLVVVEDAAQGVNARYGDKFLGTMGHLGAYSFHETKNFICGEGGALLVNDPRFVERAEIIREKGTDRSRFFRGEVDKYSWVDLGSSYLPSELTAAFLYAQLEGSDRITRKRRTVWEKYEKALAPLEAGGRLRLPATPEGVSHNAHMFYILLNTPAERRDLLEHLVARGIYGTFHYVPLHSSEMGKQVAANPAERLPVTDDASARIIRLPCYYEITDGDQEYIVSEIHEFLT